MPRRSRCATPPPSAGLGGEAAYLLGLFHDVGLLALAGYYPDALEAAQALARRSELPCYAAEAPGTHHAALGAVLARHWHLPEMAVEVIRTHHGLEPAPPSVAPIVTMLQVAERLGAQAGVEGPGEGWLAPLDPLGVDAVGLPPEELEDLVWEIRGALEQTGAALSAAR